MKTKVQVSQEEFDLHIQSTEAKSVDIAHGKFEFYMDKEGTDVACIDTETNTYYKIVY